MPSTINIQAAYRRTGALAFDGNPLIEALPPLEETKNAIVDRLAYLPSPPSAADRAKSEVVRLGDLSLLNSIVYPLSEYKQAGVHATQNIREAYVGRNPLALEDETRRRSIVDGRCDQDTLFPTNFASTARGQLLVGYSGCGKTTFANAFSLPYEAVIHHTSYQGKPLVMRQVPWVKLRIPHDATLKSLCLQFFSKMDHMLADTTYGREGERARSIAAMALVMARVCAQNAVGTIFIDEVQNLRSARGSQAEIVLNFFSELLESAGVALLIAGTPAVQGVITKSVRNIRKTTSGGENWFDLLHVDRGEWAGFCETYWIYQFVRRPQPLTKSILSAWYDCSAANPAFAVLSFLLAQRTEIGGRETVDESSFAHVRRNSMGALAPAIAALRTKNPSALKHFDDLFFWRGQDDLASLVTRTTVESSPTYEEEFDEIVDTVQNPKGKPRSTMPRSNRSTRAQRLETISLPKVDPFAGT